MRLSIFASALLLFKAQVQGKGTAAGLPSCGVSCLQSAVGEDSYQDATKLWDFCNDASAYGGFETCILRNCTVDERSTISKIEANPCRQLQGGNRESVLILLAAEIPTWFCPWVWLFLMWRARRRFGVGEYLILTCGLLFTAFILLCHVAEDIAFGVDIGKLRPQAITMGIKLLYIMELFAMVCRCLPRVLILIFYWNIFPRKRIEPYLFALMAFILVPTTFFFFLRLFQCSPVYYTWDGWNGHMKPDRCLNLRILEYSIIAYDIAQNTLILALPLPLLHHLESGIRALCGFIVLFLLGIFLVGVSCMRIQEVLVLGGTISPMANYTNGIIWTSVEVCTLIIIACLPPLWTLFTEKPTERTTTEKPSSGNDDSVRTRISQSVKMKLDYRPMKKLYLAHFSSGGDNESQIAIRLGDGDSKESLRDEQHSIDLTEVNAKQRADTTGSAGSNDDSLYRELQHLVKKGIIL